MISIGVTRNPVVVTAAAIGAFAGVVFFRYLSHRGQTNVPAAPPLDAPNADSPIVQAGPKLAVKGLAPSAISGMNLGAFGKPAPVIDPGRPMATQPNQTVKRPPPVKAERTRMPVSAKASAEARSAQTQRAAAPTTPSVAKRLPTPLPASWRPRPLPGAAPVVVPAVGGPQAAPVAVRLPQAVPAVVRLPEAPVAIRPPQAAPAAVRLPQTAPAGGPQAIPGAVPSERKNSSLKERMAALSRQGLNL